ncbi:MAG: DNA-directed RNA polymerase subunit beta [Candidatus Sumerlaeales bacterium]|nr:DNA-directed RNA polymerase subunit beta [Candidatus Sumerlaeales bacterium]
MVKKQRIRLGNDRVFSDDLLTIKPIDVQLNNWKNLMGKESDDSFEDAPKALNTFFDLLFPIKGPWIATKKNKEIQGILYLDGYRLSGTRYSNWKEYVGRSGLDYARTVIGTVRLVVNERDAGSTEESATLVEDFGKTVELFSYPEMTPNGTFVISGIERVILMQMTRSPGVYVLTEKNADDHDAPIVRIQPNRGMKIELSAKKHGALIVSFGKNKKQMLFTSFMSLWGISHEDIIAHYETVIDLDHWDMGKHVVYLSQDIMNPETQQPLLPRMTKVTENVLEVLSKHQLQHSVKVLKDSALIQSLIEEQSASDDDEQDALIQFQMCFRSNTRNREYARQLHEMMFHQSLNYSLGKSGRSQMNERLAKESDSDFLEADDLFAAADLFAKAVDHVVYPDDIDHLGNRRIRCAAEQLLDFVLIPEIAGMRSDAFNMLVSLDLLTRIELFPPQLLSFERIQKNINSFFHAKSEVTATSQYMDQVNPLSSLTHERRVTVLGHGGISRENAGFEVRDVHHSYFGRICPIETPEGGNIGLISSLAMYARINDAGKILTPYHNVINGVVQPQIVWLDAFEDEKCLIVSADTETDAQGHIVPKEVSCKYGDDVVVVNREKIQLICVSTEQMLSLSAALIPFIKHDDANRALMGANMQRQALPLMYPVPPIVGTGKENICADIACLKSDADGIVSKLTSTEIALDYSKSDNTITYEHPYFKASNQGTLIKYTPRVVVGEHVDKGQLLADAQACFGGELSLGRNVHVAFMPFEGWNYEDAIVISERMIKQNAFKSITVQEFQINIMHTSQGDEELSNEIPNVSMEILEKLNSEGIIKIGTRIKHGDILVGKITPKLDDADKSNADMDANEDKLIRAIFGRKAAPFIDTSLRYRESDEGVVVDVEIFERKNPVEYHRALNELNSEYQKTKDKLNSDYEAELRKIESKEKELRGKLSYTAKVIAREVKAKFSAVDAQKIAEHMESAETSSELSDDYMQLKEYLIGCGQNNEWENFDAIYSPALEMVDDQLINARLLAQKELKESEKTELESNLQQIETEYLNSLRKLEPKSIGYNELVNERERLCHEFDCKLYEVASAIVKKDHYIEDVGEKDATPVSDDIRVERLIKTIRSGMIPTNGDENREIKAIFQKHTKELMEIDDRLKWAKQELEEGAPLEPGVLKTVVVKVAVARQLSIGDKMSGRHGNKGVVSTILPEEDMPYLADGTPIDVVLNPLGVPSRMNIGQILETILGWAGEELGETYAVPAFSGCNEEVVKEKLKLARKKKMAAAKCHDSYDDLSYEELHRDINHTGQVWLYDGRTGDRFDNVVTVGVMYMLKLNHMVDDKMHARSTGTYSTITQQPLSGRARNGGQRLGEMEVWALEAYGAANILQEMITVKSDDVEGRKLMYRNLINGYNALRTGIPEGLKILQKELCGLAINLEVLTNTKNN